jgi:membrane protein YdbS with pleckstrin-like domain
MATSAYHSFRDQEFRPHPYLVGGKIVVLLAFGAGMLLAGVAHAAVIVMPVACVLFVLATRIAYCELTTILVVRGDTLLLRQGWIIWREVQIPLHRADVLTSQSLPGRLFDYGHLTITRDDRVIAVRNLGEFRRLQEEIARLQRISLFWRAP